LRPLRSQRWPNPSKALFSQANPALNNAGARARCMPRVAPGNVCAKNMPKMRPFVALLPTVKEAVQLSPLRAFSLVSFLWLAAQASAWAYPFSLNLMPTVDLVGARAYSVQLEADGHYNPFGSDRYLSLYSVVGLDERAEAAFDILDLQGETEACADAKYLLLPGDDGEWPLALGVMDVTRGACPFYYAVTAREFNLARLHLGLGWDGDRLVPQIGADYYPGDTLGLLADYQRGDDRYATLGLYYQPTAQVGLLCYYAEHNTDSESDYLGLNVSILCPRDDRLG
jgi:hypothetical protein